VAGVGPETFAGDPGMVFTVDTLRLLTRRYTGAAGVGKPLIAQLDAAEAAEQHGNARARAGLLHAFANHVRAQQGKTLSAREALVLITLAAAL
jgi:hypothetical protein